MARQDEMSKKKSNKRKGIIIALIIAVIALGFGAYASGIFDKKEEAEPVKEAIKNPLTGLEIKDGKTDLPRPFIVSTDNDTYNSRPQAGLSQADILYEVPIEGGGSRYEPIYYSQLPDLLGAVRSVRPYIVDIAKEYDAVLVHNGQSPQAKAYFESAGVDRISAARNYDIFHQEDLARLPGNHYTVGEKVFEKMKELEYDRKAEVRSFPWLEEDEEVEGEEATDITINYVDGSFNNFKYDPEKKLYTKYVKGEVLIDANNEKEISCSNILVQELTLNLYDSLRLNLDMCEGGKATVFTQGKKIEGSWSRADKSSPTIFKDQEGQEVKLTPGVTWIQVIDRTVTFKAK